MTNFDETRSRFQIPDGVIYLDGNSLGPLPRGVQARAAEVMQHDWGTQLITAWNKAGWMDLPRRVGDRVGGLIGAPAGSVVMGDTLSVKVFQALSAALKLSGDRKVILSDTGNFPSDLYMAQGLIAALDQGHQLRTVAPEAVTEALSEDVAVLMLTHVDYRTGRMHDMAALTQKAQALGIVVIWDLAHSAGAVPVDLTGAGPEFAVGCTYKYLNGGPGAPAFIYVRPDLQDTAFPVLSGWLGHEAPFAFDADYRPAAGIERMRCGTPPVIQMSVLDAALDAWDGVTIAEVRAQSIALSQRFIAAVEAACPDLTLVSPRDPLQRGSQVSFAFEHGYPAMQALIARGVIGDFRAPDIMRFGITPLYLSADDIDAAAAQLAAIVNDRLWDSDQYRARNAVT
ncbi:kynureninase [Pseudoprimorskyibacter insulae]|uniref:Kynureninase n=1 Tax=Pseudoprimorskyibacter insulae TaxID=1695997 RepID=A0A2R8AUY2_9RHOB|nr:kynureninase [Pseudoprimorskyibacter insulae]SPF79800.1 Kynureninase [Pseudoprimorskyibacter insulae]